MKTSIVLPIILSILNLAFCAWFQDLLRDDPEGYHLTLYLLVECTVFVLFLVGLFSESLAEILYRTRTFAVGSPSRCLLILVSNATSPAIVLYWISNILFLIVHYHGNKVAIAAIPVLFTLMVAFLVSINAVVLAGTSGAPRLPVGVLIAYLLVLSALYTGIYVFRSETLLCKMPVLSWTVDGIFAAEEGGWRPAAKEMGRIAAAIVVTLIVGILYVRRFPPRAA